VIKEIIHTTIKVLIVALLSSVIAYLLNINDYILVGILGILSVSITKKETIKNSAKRYINVLYALLLGTIFFGFFGFNLLVFIIFIAVFLFTSYLLKIDIGLVPGIVLVNHIYNYGTIDKSFILEEALIITIAVFIAVFVNIIYPSYWEKEAKLKLKEVDNLIKNYLNELSKSFNDKKKKAKEKYSEEINKAINENILFIEHNEKNKLFLNDYRYLAYIYMRKEQINRLNNIYENYLKINVFHQNQIEISKYLSELETDISDQNYAIKQLNKLDDLLNEFKKEELPKTRDEFETRALLFYIVEELNNFLKVKETFHEKFPLFKL